MKSVSSSSSIALGRNQCRCRISLNLVSGVCFGFSYGVWKVNDLERCGNCGKAETFSAEAFPSSLRKSSNQKLPKATFVDFHNGVSFHSACRPVAESAPQWAETRK